MMKLFLILLLLLPASLQAADDPNLSPKVAEQIRQQNRNMNINSIWRTPIPGIYEIAVGSNIYYMERSGKYLITGHLFETASKRDLTAPRLEQINKIDWAVLPLGKAIVSGDSDGVEMAVFTDPDCPYCRKFEEELKSVKGVKVYTFLFPLTKLHPDARRKSEAIWCSKDRHAALLKVMLDDKAISGGGCETPLDEITALAGKLNITGTPTIIARDGRKLGGMLSADRLKPWLEGK